MLESASPSLQAGANRHAEEGKLNYDEGTTEGNCET